MPIAGPFYFAWVNSTATTFGSEHLVMDEHIFSIQRSLIEGEKPLLELEIKNPRTGLLNPTRKFWAWLSYYNGSSVIPLFFGRLVGNPMELMEEVITIQLIADPKNYRNQKQAIAQAKKVLPYYDPVFFDVMARDDANKILETYGEFWNVDPVTHAVSAVGFTEGPDGNVDLNEDDHFYDSMRTTVSEPPATVIRMDATVPWTQSGRGNVYLGGHLVDSLTDAIRGEWPQPLTQLGGGWSVSDSLATVTNGADAAMGISHSESWQSSAKKHSNGDTISTSFSQTKAMGPIAQSIILTQQEQTGVIDPFAVDEDGDPSPLNIPATFANTSAHVVQYIISTSLTLEYIAERPRTERVIFTIKADTQPILTDPEIEQTSENITLVGADVSVPIIEVMNWTTLSGGQAVALGQVVFPDNPRMPGGTTAQIAVVAGVTGHDTPDFSDIPGFTTIDGTVTWSSMGVAEPSSQAGDWQKSQHFNLGDIITPRRPLFVTYNSLVTPGQQMFPPQGTAFTEGSYIQFGGAFLYVTAGGQLLPNGSNSASFVTIATLPSGTGSFICIQAGTTGAILPAFNETVGANTSDGTVIWTCVAAGGSAEIPIGGVPGKIHAPSYFTLERGKRSLEYLALLVRAKLLWRARCVDISFDVEWNTGIAMSTRKTVRLYDPRLAGGVVGGKIKSAILNFSDRGEAVCTVTIGCLVGKDNAVGDNPGTPSHVDEGYVIGGYQRYDAVVLLMPTGSDLAYTPLEYAVTDDGLTFPLTADEVVVKDEIESIGDMEGEVAYALRSMKEAAESAWSAGRAVNPGAVYDPFQMAWDREKTAMLQSANSVQNAIAGNPRFINYEIKPVNAGPFHAVYSVEFSDLTMAKGVDLLSEVEG